MSNRSSKFNNREILEVFTDLLYRKLQPTIVLRDTFNIINQELEEFLGVPNKKYAGQLLYVVSDTEQIKQSFVKYLEDYYCEINKRVKRIEGLEFVFEIVYHVGFPNEFDVLIIENVEEFYKTSKEIQKRLFEVLQEYLDNGGKLLITGNEFDGSDDALGKILYQGNLLNLSYDKCYNN